MKQFVVRASALPGCQGEEPFVLRDSFVPPFGGDALPLSPAIKMGNTLYIAGQLGVDPRSGQLAEGVEAQARQALQNIGAILKTAGFGYTDVVQVTVLLADLNDFAKFNAVYKTFFTRDFPTRAAYQIGALPKGCRVEIVATAVREDAGSTAAAATHSRL